MLSSQFLFGFVLLVILRGKIQGSITIIMLISLSILCVVGVDCFSLSSSPLSSEEGHIIACPHTTVTLTCTATQVGSMTWFENNREMHVFSPSDYDSEETRVVYDDSYTLTLIAVDNIITTDGHEIGDFIALH